MAANKSKSQRRRDKIKRETIGQGEITREATREEAQ